MAELKTAKNDGDVDAFLAAVADDRRRADAQAVTALMREVTGEEPAMWGDSIVGFGVRQLRYASGREVEWPVLGLSPRKQSLTVYLLEGFESHTDVLERLGPHSTGQSCLYIKRLDKVDQDVLRELVADSWRTSSTT